MELRLGSVWLLLSYSLQQSLLGILAIVPQTNAKDCIGSNGEPVKKVQMIRRIPARCSGWEEAWSWASKTDCSTKYVYDYVELPSAMAGDVDEDCENEQAASAEKDHFSVTEEKFLAIAFGSATVALLVLIVIIVISLLRRGQSRCHSLCGGGPAYSSANRSERENGGQQGHACNEYVDEAHRLSGENVYEEIKDAGGTKAKLPVDSDTDRKGFHASQDYPAKEKPGMPVNGVSNGVVIPSAPFEEDLQQTTFVKSVQNEQGSIQGNRLSSTSDTCLKEHGIAEQKMETKDDEKEKDAEKKGENSKKSENVYSKFNDIVAHKKTESDSVQPEAPLLPISADNAGILPDNTGKTTVLISAVSHSYENLQADMQCDLDGSGYDSLIKSQSDSGLSLTCANDVDGIKFDSFRNGQDSCQEAYPLEDLNRPAELESISCSMSDQCQGSR